MLLDKSKASPQTRSPDYKKWKCADIGDSAPKFEFPSLLTDQVCPLTHF